MTFDELLTFYDHKQINVAKALGLHKQVIFRWRQAKKVPYDKQCVIEILTNGALKASKEH